MSALARALIGLGAVFILMGFAVVLADRLGLRLGRLPGDLFYRGRHGSIYFPIVTCLVVSVLLSVLVSFLSKGRH